MWFLIKIFEKKIGLLVLSNLKPNLDIASIGYITVARQSLKLVSYNSLACISIVSSKLKLYL